MGKNKVKTQIIVPETAGIKQERNPDGTFPKGVSGNPAGTKPGTRHFKTLFIEAVKEIGAKNARGEDISKDKVIVKKVIEMAMNGNLKAIDTVLDRVDGKPAGDESPLLQINLIGLTEEQKVVLEQLL